MAGDRSSDREIIEKWEITQFEPMGRANAIASLAAPGEVGGERFETGRALRKTAIQ
jgi:hypothetical protein